MFVLMASHGEYSDRSVWTVGWTATEPRAKELVLELAERDKVKIAIETAKAKLTAQFMEEWSKVNPQPVAPDISRPVFDQAQRDNKQYVAEHTERKHAWEKALAEYQRGPYAQWMKARADAAAIYVDANFTMDLCEPVEWTDNQYWYEEIEELI